MAVIKAKQIPKRKERFSATELLVAEFCYLFPAYTYQMAMDLPLKQIAMMVRVANRVKAEYFLTLTNIVASPHTKKGEGVKKMVSLFNKIIGENS